MARPPCCRRVACQPATTVFKPAGVPARELEEVVITLDEFEALRLADLEGLYQEHAAERMAISRPTFGRILESAHRKVARALVRGKVLKIEGGPIAEEPSPHPEADLRAQWETLGCTGRRRSAWRENPEDASGNWKRKGESK